MMAEDQNPFRKIQQEAEEKKGFKESIPKRRKTKENPIRESFHESETGVQNPNMPVWKDGRETEAAAGFSAAGRTEHKKYKKHKKRRQPNPVFLLVFWLVILLSGAWCGHAAVDEMIGKPEAVPGMDQEMLENINILALGCDEREGDTAMRADVIMVATIRPEAHEISVFSIPRDTRVKIEGHGMDKINHSMAFGGIPLVTRSVEDLLGIQIDHVVKVNFDGFINVVDALGGINIEVPCRMYKPLEAIDLQPGYQTLNGSEALAFVRWRGDGTGDYGRIERQQQFLSAISEKVKGMSIKQTMALGSAVMDSIETDMSIRQMTAYGMDVLKAGTENIKTYSFQGQPVMIHGVSYVEPDLAAIADIVDKMQHGEPEVPEGTQPEDGAAPQQQTE